MRFGKNLFEKLFSAERWSEWDGTTDSRTYCLVKCAPRLRQGNGRYATFWLKWTTLGTATRMWMIRDRIIFTRTMRTFAKTSKISKWLAIRNYDLSNYKRIATQSHCMRGVYSHKFKQKMYIFLFKRSSECLWLSFAQNEQTLATPLKIIYKHLFSVCWLYFVKV